MSNVLVVFDAIKDEKKKIASYERILRKYSKRNVLNYDDVFTKYRLLQVTEEKKNMITNPKLIEIIDNYIQNEKKYLEERKDHLKTVFPAKLNEALQASNIKLEGVVPRLRASLYSINVDFEKRSVKIFYGPNVDFVKKTKIVPNSVASAITGHSIRLESSSVEPSNFSLMLDVSYDRALKENQIIDERKVRLIEVFDKIKSTSSLKDFDKAAFSYNLFRLRGDPKYSSQFIFSPATRSQAAKKDYVWVPNSRNVHDGTFYSRMEVVRK